MEEKSKVEPPPFPEILYALIQDGDSNLIQWAFDGAAFAITPVQPALNELLKKFFNHGKYTSLQRQLSLYNFKRATEGKFEGAYFHPLFHRDRKHDLHQIRRKPAPSRRRAAQPKLGTRKRKIKRRSSEASESSSLIREAALGKANGEQETYYYESDISTANENSTLGGDDYDNAENNNNKHHVPRNVPMRDGEGPGVAEDGNDKEREEGGKVLKLDFKGETPKEQKSTNKIILPFVLKKVMINTWENITLKKLIPNLPAPFSVRKLLDLYVDAKVDHFSSKSINVVVEGDSIEKKKAGWKDLAEGIALFFDKAVESRLLYREERPQYRALTAALGKEKRRLSDIYGSEHLLRLLLRLPDILAECVNDETRRRILHDMSEFVRFLHQHKDTLCATTVRELTAAELEEIQKADADDSV